MRIPTQRLSLAATAAGCAALIAACWLIAFERIRYEHANAVEDVVRQNANLALAFEAQTLHAIQRASQTLISLKSVYEREGRVPELRELALEGNDETLIPNLLVTDREGNVLRADGKRGPVNIADRDLFDEHRRDPGRGPWVSKPLSGKVTGRTVISVSRPLTDADGAFRGIAAVALDPNFFLDSYRKFDIGSDGEIQLVGLDGTVRARRRGDAVSFGEDLRDSTILRLAGAASAGNFITRGHSGIRRYTSYRVLPGYPLIVSVGASVDQALASYRSRERGYLQAALAATLLIVLFGAGLGLALWRRKRALQELAASEELYRATFEQAAVGVVHTALDGAFLKANRNFCEMLGYTEQELLARSFSDVTHPDDRKLGADLAKALLGPDSAAAQTTLENRYLRKDGSPLWAAVVVAAVHAPDGSPRYFIAVVRDITARKRAEARERRAEARYRATFDQAAVGIVHADLKGRLVDVNDRFCRMLGRPRAELIGRNFADITHPEDKEVTFTVGRELAVGQDRSPEYEKRYLRGDGSIVWAAVAISAVRDGRGVIEYFIAVVEDISARKEAEQRLLEQLDELRRFQKVTVDRELRMLDLQQRLRAFEQRASA